MMISFEHHNYNQCTCVLVSETYYTVVCVASPLLARLADQIPLTCLP